MSAIFDTKTETSGEMEVLRSRMVVGPAVDKFLLYIHARPNYFPVVGARLAQRHESFPYPGGLALGGYAWGGEISVSQLDVPNEWLGKPLRVTTLGDGRYTLFDKITGSTFTGTVGTPQHFVLPGGGALDVHIDALSGRPGTEFTVSRSSRLAAIEDAGAHGHLRARSRLGRDRRHAGRQRSRADHRRVERDRRGVRAAEREPQGGAGRSVVELPEQQLPQMKKDLDAAETVQRLAQQARHHRPERGSSILAQSVDAQTKVMELRAKRQD